MIVKSEGDEFNYFIGVWLTTVFFNFFTFGCTGWLLLRVDFSYGAWGLLPSCRARVSHFGGFSYCGARARGDPASVVVVEGLSCPAALGFFWTRDQTASLALQGRFLTTESPGRPWLEYSISFRSQQESQYFCTLQNDQYDKSSYQLSPYKVITILSTMFMLYIACLWLIYLITGHLSLLISLPDFAHPPTPSLLAATSCSLHCEFVWLCCVAPLVLFFRSHT